ncbi:MAG: DUF4349 domain-containing protein [Ruminococcus sp.]|nr:DUF4349 domain-containing protein [Ruminococcus sp.]
MKNSNKIFIPVILSALLFTGCGNKEEMNQSVKYDNVYTESYDNNAEEAPAVENSEESVDESQEAEKENNTSNTVIRKEMLVYSCNLVIDVLDFDTAIDSFRSSLDTYDAFVEKENYNDGGASDRLVYENEQSWKTYNATVRVPSKDYNDFCDNMANLGDLRKKDAIVDNLTSEYYDLSTTLEIYEAKEARYLELLSTVDEQTAIALEKELTDIQIEISRLVTRMNKIQTDVAYSYVYITINEVREYVEEPTIEKTDTFGQRFKNTVSQSVSGFLSVMETLLFILIYLLPHLVIIGIFIFGITALSKAIKKKRIARYPQNPPVNQQIPTVNTPQTPSDDENIQENSDK